MNQPLILDCEQCSPEWYELRRGVPTSSEASKIITPKTGKLSASATGYIAELIAETVCVEDGWQGNNWTERGKDLEPEARAWYAFDRGVEVREVGFVMRNGCGWSPDGLIGENGAVEIKCPAAHTHVKYLMAGVLPDEYKVQCHAALSIGHREWIDFLSYHPSFDPLVVRVHADNYTKKVTDALADFVVQLEAARKAVLREAA